MITTETKFVVRYAETDQMGIVHHSNYPVWFEAGRTDYIRMLGISYSEIESKGILFPLIDMNCKFLDAARYEDEIKVITSIGGLTPVRVTFNYEVYKNGSNSPISKGSTVHTWTNTGLKPVSIKKKMPEIYDEMKRNSQSFK